MSEPCIWSSIFHLLLEAFEYFGSLFLYNYSIVSCSDQSNGKRGLGWQIASGRVKWLP